MTLSEYISDILGTTDWHVADGQPQPGRPISPSLYRRFRHRYRRRYGYGNASFFPLERPDPQTGLRVLVHSLLWGWHR